jgi:hypothetical protein
MYSTLLTLPACWFQSLCEEPTHPLSYPLAILFQFLEFHNNRDGSRKLTQAISSKQTHVFIWHAMELFIKETLCLGSIEHIPNNNNINDNKQQ